MESLSGNCVGCERLARRVAALEEQVARLLADNERLCGELAAAKKNSSTSSKPPSSDIIKPDANARKGKGGRRKRKIGGQPSLGIGVSSELPSRRMTSIGRTSIFTKHAPTAAASCATLVVLIA
jgi:hypothetical protein